MATPMRDSSLDGGHRPRVADSRTTAKAESSNFEYDDNEWDIGIGDLIIDLDADIEKTNEGVAGTAGSMASTGGGGPSAAKKALAVEHSATVDKGLKMKIKRTKPGTKTSEAKHEIVKSNEQAGQQAAQQQGQPGQNVVAQPTIATTQQNGAVDVTPATGTAPVADKTKHTISASAGSAVNTPPGGASKRGSSGHRRDKAKDKHSGGGGGDKASPKPAAAPVQQPGATAGDIVRVGTAAPGPQRPTTPQQQRAAFPATGPGPPAAAQPSGPPAPPPSPSAATAQGSASKPEQTKVAAVVIMPSPSVATAATVSGDDRCGSPPPAKKLKISNEPKGMLDVCVGTSVGTITEPDCLGPCEPGTSVTLEGIVWHETEGGVLVVNVTWRGKTYVGTLLDCTRHDWAPPRFCDSPTSDLDARTPKGRGKRGRAAANATPGNDLSNFTETRSSVHSKLRNGGGKGRRGGANGGGSNSGPASTGTSSPTPFIPPRPEPSSKRKSRSGEEETPVATPTGKKSRVASAPTPPAVPASPPASPVLLECPEPNCSKKYKHINGLKYHQSHAHGSADDDDTKDVTSMSENDESNIEAPSPVTPVKSPEKVIEAPATPQKKEEVVTTPVVPEVISAPGTPRSTPPSPPQVVVPSPELTPAPAPPLVLPIAEQKSVVKPGVLRFGPQEDFAVGAFGASKPPTSSVQVCSGTNLTTVRAVSVTIAPSQPQTESTTFTNQLAQVTMTTQPQIPQATQLPTPTTHQPHLQNALGHQNHTPLPQQQPPVMQPQQQQNKIPQFKVKPTAALMPDDKKDRNKPQNYKKKNRKSPAGSPHPHPQPEQPVFGLDQAGRDEVQSPAYSDISDDAAPVLESEVSDKNKPADKKTEPGQTMPHSMPQYGMYPFYGQPPYLVQQVQDGKPKEGDKTDKIPEKDPKKDGPEYQQKMLPQHYYSYGYVPGYTYNMDPSYGAVSMVPEDKLKEERIKESPSPAEHTNKPAAPIPNPIQVPTPGKVKTEQAKDKHQNENHQILKESIEMKNQMNPYMYSRQPQQQPAHINHHHHQQQQQSQQQREDEMRRYYLYPDQQRRKEQQQPDPPQKTPNKMPPQSPSVKHKEKLPEEKKDKEVKQEGVKPTMETQGPPPPPTSQYAYAIHPSYLQSPHYGALPFDPNHPMYRNMLVPGPYSGSPYLHPHTTIPRYHAPEDLSRPPQGPTKALDLLQHHANQYYTSHKIHELQERAMKSPTPKTSVASASPSSGGGGGGGAPPSGAPPGAPPPGGPVTTQSGGITTTGANGKQTPVDSKESRSPPPQRHVHTHHHTHVGLGYPLYAPPYGAAVLASQQAAAVTVINPYPPK